jgi:hypothetical protein
MKKAFWRSVALPVVGTALAAPFMVHCGKVPKVNGVPDVPGGLNASCPDVSNVDALEKMDLVKDWGLSADAAGKLKNGVIAAVYIKKFADTVENDLKTSCTTLATDLGATGTYANADAACKAASTALAAAKAKIGGSGSITVDVAPPQCGASMDVMASCSGKCDASASGGSAKVECEPGKLEGSCDAQCTGDCSLSAAAACSGTCSGTCDASVKGKCTGTCTGKCDGKKSSGSCAGTCDGKCDAHVEGTCTGNCGGDCKLSGAASCKGTCTGSCSAEMKAPSCAGEMTPPKVSAECKAKCDGEVNANLTCTPAQISLVLTGKGGDAKAFAAYKTVVEKDLPAIVKTALGLGQRATKMASSVKDVVAGVQSGVTASVKAGGANGAVLAGKIGTCFGGPFGAVGDAAGSVSANVTLSVNVQASAGGATAGASASASASAGAK